MLLHEIIERNARRLPYREAIVGEGYRLTHRKFAQRVERIARSLAGLGIAKGDRVLVQMGNLVPYAELYFSVPMLGAILVPLNVRLTPRELRYFVRHSAAVCWVADLERATVLAEDFTEWGEIRERVVVGGPLKGWHSYEELAPADEVKWPSREPSVENDVI